jgi:hypothetical protein
MPRFKIMIFSKIRASRARQDETQLVNLVVWTALRIHTKIIIL